MSDFEDGMAVGLAIGRKKFSGGGGGDTPKDEKWEYPSDWLPLPEVGENEVAALFFAPADVGDNAAVRFNCSNYPDSVDWGDPNGDNTNNIRHVYAFERGTPYSDKVSMFVLKAHFPQNVNFGYFMTGAGYMAACAVNGSAIDPSVRESSIHDSPNKCLQYIKITGDMTNFDKRNFISSFPSLRRVDFEKSPTHLTNSMFYRCYNLTPANMPDLSAVKSVGDNCFQDCSSLSEIKLPALTTAGEWFCSGCYGLKNAYLPALETIGNYGFSYCQSLCDADFPQLTTAGDDFLGNNNYSLKNLSLPKLQTVGDSSFYGCYALETADLRSLTTVTNNKIGYDCYSLRELNMPNIDKTQSGIFPHSYLIKQTEEE